MAKAFRPWDLQTTWLFPPSVLEFVPANHLAHFVRDVVREEIDLSPILAVYVEERGQPPYHPALMTALLLYAYTQGVYSSRRIEKACVERLDFFAVTAMAKPDHSTIAEFRRRHRPALKDLFVEVLLLCREAGLVSLGHVALDGTKVKANASKHKAMSYGRMKEVEPKLTAEVEEFFQKAEQADSDDDDEHGSGRKGDELPAWVANRLGRREKIREAIKRIEDQAKVEAKRAKEEIAVARKAGLKPSGAALKRARGKPEPKAQSNFTDPESRIMKTGDGFVQAYNCQLAVDAESHVIVAQQVSAHGADSRQLVPLLDAITANAGTPREVSADAGYCSEANLEAIEERGIRGYVATGRQTHGSASATSNEAWSSRPNARIMRQRLRHGGFQSRYRLRKKTVEPVIGQIKEARGFRRFLTRGLEAVAGEWSLIATAHNLLKLAASRLAIAHELPVALA